jgi:hypothetical protein
VSWPIFFIAVVFSYFENRYFGWNMHPESDAEMIADGIGMILFALAFVAEGK